MNEEDKILEAKVLAIIEKWWEPKRRKLEPTKIEKIIDQKLKSARKAHKEAERISKEKGPWYCFGISTSI